MSMSGPPPEDRAASVTDPATQLTSPQPWMPPNASNTPNAERYLLEADALRRRQLRSALLHGSSRTWREQRRIWPGVVAGIVVVAVVLASFAVMKAFKKQEDVDQQNTPQTPSVSTTSS
jgi:hypothetical protein